MAWQLLRVAVLVSLAAVAGCSGEPLGGHPGAGGRTGAGGVVGSGGVSAMGGAGAATGCGAVEVVPIAPPSAPPDILILMDRSASLQISVGTACDGGCGGPSRWSALTSAVEDLMAGNLAASWGLMLFGSDDSCGLAYAPQVPVAPGTGSRIESVLAGSALGGEAPTAAAINLGAGYLKSLADGSPKYLLLVSDGLSGCTSDLSGVDAAAEAAVLSATEMGIPTFVLAPPDLPAGTAVAALDKMAMNGAYPLVGGANAYYTPTDDLAAALQPADAINSCLFPVTDPPPPGSTLGVFATTTDGHATAIGQDPLDGWTFTDASESTLILNGMSCATLKQGGYTMLTLDYACSTPALPPP